VVLFILVKSFFAERSLTGGDGRLYGEDRSSSDIPVSDR